MNYNSCHEDDEEEEEEDEHSKDLHHQPPVGGDGLKIPKNEMNVKLSSRVEYQLSQHSLQDLVVTKLDVESSVVNVVVDPGHHLLLLLHHGGQLAEDAPQLHDGALNGVHGVRPTRVVLVLVLIDGGELLRAAHVDHSVSSL